MEAGFSPAQFSQPSAIQFYNDKMYVADAENQRVTIFDPMPVDETAEASSVGWPEFLDEFDNPSETCDRTDILKASDLSIGGGKMVVADSEGHRLLIWNKPPESSGIQALTETIPRSRRLPGTKSLSGVCRHKTPTRTLDSPTRLEALVVYDGFFELPPGRTLGQEAG